MTEEDIRRIEAGLSLRLPADYRQLLLDYPFPRHSVASTCMLINDAEKLIRANTRKESHTRTHSNRARWEPQKRHLYIGSDGGEERYYLDVEDSHSAISMFDLETGELTPYASGCEDYRRKIYEIDKHREEEDGPPQVEGSRQWWKFW